MLASTSVECLIYILVCPQWVILSLSEQTLKVSYDLIFARIHSVTLLLLPPQEVKGWHLGEQQHILGAEEGPWLQPHRFSHSVVTSELLIAHIFKPAQPLMWSRLVLVTSVSQSYIHIPYWSSLLLFIKVNALIASAYISCVNMFMQTYPENVDTFWHFFAHVSTWYVSLYHSNW